MIKKNSSRHILKLISLVIASTLWFYVLNSEPLEVIRRAPLVFITPTDQAINVSTPRSVKVRVRGSRAFVQNLDFSQEKMVIDLRDYPYDQETFAVTFEPTMLNLPFGVEVLDIEPQQIVLSLEREIRKVVPVRLRTIGEVRKDLTLVDKNFAPKEFMISGPYNVLKKIALLNTAPLDLSSLDGSGQIRLPLERIDDRVSIENEKDIVLDYVIRPNKANFTLSDVPISFLTRHSGFIASSRKASIDVLVAADAKELGAKDVKIIAELPDEIKNNTRIKLQARLPEGVNLLQIQPEFINVSLQ